MNFLAHLFLSDGTPESMVGSIMPDLVRGRISADIPSAVHEAILLHRRVDAFTDHHPFIAHSKLLLRERHGRYAGVLVDVYDDHLLSVDWRRYTTVPRETFVEYAKTTLKSHRHLMPAAMQASVGRMIEQDWLNAYATTAGVGVVLARMSRYLTRRFERPVDLTPAVDDLAAHHDQLLADFRAFFPQLLEQVKWRPWQVKALTPSA